MSTNIDAAIAKAKADHAARMRALRVAKARQEKAAHAKVADLLRDQDRAHYDRLLTQALGTPERVVAQPDEPQFPAHTQPPTYGQEAQ